MGQGRRRRKQQRGKEKWDNNKRTTNQIVCFDKIIDDIFKSSRNLDIKTSISFLGNGIKKRWQSGDGQTKTISSKTRD